MKKPEKKPDREAEADPEGELRREERGAINWNPLALDEVSGAHLGRAPTPEE